MDAIASQQIGPIVAAMGVSKGFYASPANTLLRMTVDSSRRDLIVHNLQGATATELWHAAVQALQKPDPELAAAVVHVLNTLPMNERPFGVAEFASRFAYEPHEDAVRAINSADRDAQAAILLWRVVQQGKVGPVGRLKEALRRPVVPEVQAEAIELPSQGADTAAYVDARSERRL